MCASLGYLPHTALLTGVGLIQVGEFSFILADSATTLGIVGPEFFSLAVVSAVLSMAFTPWAIAGASRATGVINRRFGWLSPYRLDNGRSEGRIPHWKATASSAAWEGLGHWWPGF